MTQVIAYIVSTGTCLRALHLPQTTRVDFFVLIILYPFFCSLDITEIIQAYGCVSCTAILFLLPNKHSFISETSLCSVDFDKDSMFDYF